MTEKLFATPVTMLFTNARVVPHIARACFVSFFGAIVTTPSATTAVTSLLTTRRNAPRLPWRSGSVPTSASRPRSVSRRDACHHVTWRPSEHAAEDLAADFCGAGLIVRHDPSRGRQNGDAQPVIAARQVDDARINAPARLRHARNLPNYRLAIDVFELDAQLRDASTNIFAGKAADVSLALQHFEHIGADLRGGAGDRGLPPPPPPSGSRPAVSEGIARRPWAPPPLPPRPAHRPD